MEWTDQVGHGDWIRARLDAATPTMHSVVPHGYPAYARVLHRPHVVRLPGRPVPTQDEWMRMPEAERQRLSDAMVYGPTTWAETARAFGTVVHSEAQWNRLVRTSAGDWQHALAPDGREFEAPTAGQLDPDLVAAVARHLAAHTTTPDDVFVTIWEGWGGLTGFFGQSPGRTFMQLAAHDQTASATRAEDAERRAADAAVYAQHNAMLGRSIHDSFNTVLGQPTWQPGILSDEISRGARLRLPARDHILFHGRIDELADPEWAASVPWRDPERERLGLEPAAESPSLVWPADRAWTMVTEVDFDSTIVGGSAELIRAIVADPLLEALRLEEGADLSWDADGINR
ncbi:hypothetical protein [Microbacterium rhizomatis]|uniref:Uncharacterized protein n=1 Tax=Microbacterium rhizomatis TaxID=1631477 RepID=A0A5J5J254_9MICO|nr:hypothetical protein [Microbacterium rhizomatis]KAA9108457.1 hypothetical protein F6B43_13885 [Microbacterium rhizomatis]